MTEDRCTDVAVRLSAGIDGELDASEAAGVREHLATCVSCRRRHALLTAASKAVRSLPPEAVSAGFEDDFRRRLAAARTGAGRPRGRSPVLVGAVALAAVLALVVLGPFAWRRASPPSEARTAASKAVPRWLATCGAPTAIECLRDAPCASASACGIVLLRGELPLPARHASVAAAPAGAPCASAATCGVAFVASPASALRFAPGPARQ